jgi:hypothetical protein
MGLIDFDWVCVLLLCNIVVIINNLITKDLEICIAEVLTTEIQRTHRGYGERNIRMEF